MGGFMVNGCGVAESFYQVKFVEKGYCKCCKKENSFSLYELRNKIRVFFVPTVTINSKYAIACDKCKNGYYVSEEQKNAVLYERVKTVIVNDGVEFHDKDKPAVAETSSLTRTMTIDDVFDVSGRGTVITGVVENGTIRINDTVIINNRTFVITGIEQFGKLIDSASSGMCVGVLLKDAKKSDFRKGDHVYQGVEKQVQSAFENLEESLCKELNQLQVQKKSNPVEAEFEEVVEVVDNTPEECVKESTEASSMVTINETNSKPSHIINALNLNKKFCPDCRMFFVNKSECPICGKELVDKQ